MRLRLTTPELAQVLDAITSVTAGEGDNLTTNQWHALQRAEDKVRAALHARKDYKPE